MKTIALYHDQPERMEIDALVLSSAAADKRLYLVLDASPFYPEGGGQPSDLGRIAGLAVLDVQIVEGEHRHYVDCRDPAQLPAAGSTVHCSVDSARRQDHTGQHSAQHLLSATVLRLIGAATKSFHLGEDYCSIDIDCPQVDGQTSRLIEAEVQAAIDNGYALHTHVCSHAEAEQFDLRRLPPADEDQLRIVEIDGFDFTPCCGTHVGDTSQLRLFRLLRAEKYKSMTRLYFLAGERAVADYRKLAELSSVSAALLGCAEADIALFVQQQAEKLQAAERQLAAQRLALAACRSEYLLALAAKPAEQTDKSIESSGLDLIYSTDAVIGIRAAALDMAEAQLLAKTLAGHGRVALVLAVPVVTVVAVAPDSSWQLGRTLSPLLPAKDGKSGPSAFSGARGGGGPASFQAALPDNETALAFLKEACRLLSLAAPQQKAKSSGPGPA